MEEKDFNFILVEGKWYVGKSDTSSANGLVDPSNVVNVFLPRYHQGILVYGTRYRCFFELNSLKRVFIPNTYKVIYGDFVKFSRNLESIVFEENSQIETIYGYFAEGTSIREMYFPASLKMIDPRSIFNSCNSLQRVFFASMIKVEYNAYMFPNRDDIQIFVPVNYKYDLLCNRTVIRALRNVKTKCTIACRQKKNNGFVFICFLFQIF